MKTKTLRGFAIFTVLMIILVGCATPATPTSASLPTAIQPSPTLPAAPPTSTRSVAPPTSVPTAVPTATPRIVTPPTVAPTRTTGASPAAPTPTSGPAAGAAATVATARGPSVQWSESSRGLTAGMFVDPLPVQLGSQTTFGVVLTGEGGQPISDATVELTVTGGMEGMEGEHDEDFPVKLTHQGAGVYSTQTSAGSGNLVLTGMGLRIARGGQVWTFVIPKDAFLAR